MLFSKRQADGNDRRKRIHKSLVMLCSGTWDRKCHLSAVSKVLREIKLLAKDPLQDWSVQMTNPFAIRLSNS